MRRVRFTTSHPRDFGRDLVEAIESDERISNHVHLPVQSGSARVLRAMRAPTRATSISQKIAMIREAKRAISITTTSSWLSRRNKKNSKKRSAFLSRKNTKAFSLLNIRLVPHFRRIDGGRHSQKKKRASASPR